MGIELLAAIVTGVALGLFGFYLARQMSPRAAEQRIGGLVDRPVEHRGDLSWEQIRGRSRSSLPILRSFLTNSKWADQRALEIEQAGLRMRVGEYLMVRLALGFGLFVVIWLAGGSPVAFVVGLACGFFGFMLPATWISILRKRRIEKIGKQLPEAVGMIASGLRAGFAFQHGINMAAEQLQPPISEELTRIVTDLNVGATVEEALEAFLRRADSEDTNMVVTAILIQRSSGGNLAEILETVGETMRERERLVGEVKTMTSQQRFSGVVLSLWPVALLAAFSLFNWEQTSLLFTTNIGLVLLTVAGVLQVTGYYVIRRILDIDI